ncbi:MAG TPA: S-layer homology domain-containing protein [Anaerolineae bacterium]|nr:S-layer homology domain-containing protein [Anaerolineae bacterium]
MNNIGFLNLTLKRYYRLLAVLMMLSILFSIAPLSSAYAVTQPVTPMVSAGITFSLALKSDGTVWAWGRNGYAVSGDDITPPRLTPVQITGLSDMTAVSAGGSHSLALKSDGTVWAWGDNRYGQLGDGTTTNRPTPAQVPGLSGVIAISAGWDYSLALKSDGTVWAWGDNTLGELGNGTRSNGISTPAQVLGLSGVTVIAAGPSHSFAIKQDGTAWAWGWNYFGQLGDGTTTDRYTPVQVSNLSGVTGVAAGIDYSVALKQDGTVWTWGRNEFGKLGVVTTELYKPTPTQVTGLSGVTAITAGRDHTLALKPDGTVFAWGCNEFGQLGDGTTTDRHTPVQVPNISGVVAVSVDRYHSLAIKSDGTAWAWGCNEFGQLGDGTTTDRHTPVKVNIILSAGSGDTPTQPVTIQTPTIFTDVPADAWYESSVDALVAKSIISGYPDGTFRPLNNITRAEFAKMVILAIGESPTTNTASSFTDVATSYWAHSYIEKAKELGIINGYLDNTFKPAANVSRQEIAKMVVLAAKLSRATSYRDDFTDVPSTLWSWSYVLAAKDAGIISGYPDQTFKPVNPATRAEASKMAETLVN